MQCSTIHQLTHIVKCLQTTFTWEFDRHMLKMPKARHTIFINLLCHYLGMRQQHPTKMEQHRGHFLGSLPSSSSQTPNIKQYVSSLWSCHLHISIMSLSIPSLHSQPLLYYCSIYFLRHQTAVVHSTHHGLPPLKSSPRSTTHPKSTQSGNTHYCPWKPSASFQFPPNMLRMPLVFRYI